MKFTGRVEFEWRAGSKPWFAVLYWGDFIAGLAVGIAIEN